MSLAWQLQLLSPLDELHRQSAHRDTRDKVLQAIYTLLLASGAALHAGWHACLRVLERVATGGAEHAPLIALAFKSVQLVASDFLHALSPRALRRYIAVAGAYGRQADALNVALTAVGVQWAVADHLAAMQQQQPPPPHAALSQPRAAPETPPAHARLSLIHI